MSSKTILLVDDEESILDILEMNLEREGFKVLRADSGAAALKELRSGSPDLVLLDVGLPDMNGFEVCRKMRQSADVYILMVTARAQDEDKIQGLETGADDYIVKPFNPKELVARVKAILRRAERADKTLTNRLQFEGLDIDLLRRRVTYQTQSLELTPKEYDLLTFLVSRPGEVLQREEILTEVWGSEHLDARSVDVHVRYLREKLGKQGAQLIRTVWGKGYQLGGR
jgi:two-component system, OmpR family, alkaline phosphatase synthesis response regulator PhoP